MKILIVGTGLIGTSVGLALRSQGHTVWLADRSPDHLAEALALGAGETPPVDADPDVVLAAVPPAAVKAVVDSYSKLYVNSTFTDVASVKNQPVVEIQTNRELASRFVGGHPMAGRETAGPGGARGDLFKDRLWILTPTTATEPHRVDMVRQLAESCGAVVTTMNAEAHDRAVALTSHTPQVLASVMAGLIASADMDDIRLAGQGLRDLTRIAASNPELWDDILTSNAQEVEAVLDAFVQRLSAVRDALKGGVSLREMLHAGNAGRNRIPARHGGEVREDLVIVSVNIDDRPGALARLFAAAGDADISIDDVRIDHVLGREAAIVDLSVQPDKANALRTVLTNGGWQVRS